MKTRHLQEFQASGISEELITLNFASIDQEEAFIRLTYASPNSELRRNDGRLRDRHLRRYNQLEAGGWATHGLDPDTHWTRPMEWGRVKPDCPRRDWDKESQSFKDKVVKYESPAKTPNRVTYFRVGLATWKGVADRYGVEMPSYNIPIDPETGEALGFWQWVQQHPQISIVLTEGEKKAASLLSQDFVAIALPGIYTGTVRDGSQWRLHPDLKHLAQKRRNFYILFDYESTESKARQITKATVRLGKAIESEGATCHVAALPGPEKGIDDWIVAKQSDRGAVKAASIPHRIASLASLYVGLVKGFAGQCRNIGTVVRDLLANAFPLKKYCRLLVLPKAFNRLTREANRTIKERYIGNHLPQKKQRFMALKAPKGTGKTEWIARYIDNHIRNFDGRRVLEITHRVQLGSALCQRFGLPYLTDKASFSEGDSFGLGLCVNSLHPLSQARFKPEDWEGCIVVIDEVEQVLWHMLDSATCRRDRVAILSCFREVLANASEVIVADADLSDISINYIESIIGCDPWILENTYQSPEMAWDVTVYDGNNPAQLVLALTEAISRGERVLIQTSSQKHKSKWSTRTLEKKLKEMFPGLRILRIDSHTVGDKTHPAFGALGNLNALLCNYDIVIASPSIETGVSIDIRGHFNSVWAIATGKQSVQSISQAMARLREPVPRHVWVSSRGESVGDGSISAKELIENIKRLVRGQRNYLAKSHLRDLYRADIDDCDFEFQPQSVNCWAAIAARINAGALNYREALLELLKQEGHQIGFAEDRRDEAKAISQSVGECREVNYQQHCERVADPSRYIADDEEFEDLANQTSMTESERETVKHNWIARRYGHRYGVPVTSELVEKDDDGWHPKIELHYYTGEGREFLDDVSWRLFEGMSKDKAVFEPDFARKRLWAKVKLWEFLGLSDLEKVNSILSEGDPIAAPIARKCRQHREEIKLAFGVTISEKASDIQVLQALFRARGQKLVCTGRKRSLSGKALRVYSRPVADFLKDDKGKPIKDGNEHIVILPDGREQVFEAWQSRDLELRQKAIEKLEANRRVVEVATHTPEVESTAITREMLDTEVLGLPDTTRAVVTDEAVEPKLELDWLELMRRINEFRKKMTSEAFTVIRERFGQSLNTMNDCQLWELLQELKTSG